MSLRADSLDPYSRRFADRLFERHPEWASLARLDSDGPDGSLLVEVGSPVPGRALMIRTYGEQVTIDFGARGWHDHFGPWSAGSTEAVFDRALAFIDDLVADRVVITTLLLFGSPVFSRAVRAGAVRRPFFGLLDVCSWSGAVDAKLGRG